MQNPTYAVSDLAGGQNRLKDAVLYVAHACRNANRFGQTKLNKIIWRADFKAFAERGVPVTGRKYQRLPQGPCLVEMVPVQRDLCNEGKIAVERTDLGDGFYEDRVVPLVPFRSNYLAAGDIAYLDEAVSHYWNKTARETSDESHGVAWKTLHNRARMPYEAAHLADAPLAGGQLERLKVLGQRRRWLSN